MARPGALQILKRGALLTGKAFPNFVDTWNWLTRAFDSMIGDGDLNPQGYVKIDRTNPDRPIIRLNPNAIRLSTSITADNTFNVITDIGYDTSTGYIQAKTRKVTVTEDGYVTSIGAESGWIDKIATVPHSGE